MDSLYLILLALFLLVIIPRIMQRRRLAAIRHILNRKMRNQETIEMKELAKRFIGEACIIYTITSNDGSVQAVSYTHLDVYKRQMRRRSSRRGRPGLPPTSTRS